MKTFSHGVQRNCVNAAKIVVSFHQWFCVLYRVLHLLLRFDVARKTCRGIVKTVDVNNPGTKVLSVCCSNLWYSVLIAYRMMLVNSRAK